MGEQNGRVDRRTLLKVIGSAGASAAVVSACGSPFPTANAESAASVTGGRWDRHVPMASAGPGGNPNWQPGDAIKFLPPEKMPTSGNAADLLASLPKDKLLLICTNAPQANASRPWTFLRPAMTNGSSTTRIT